MFVYLGDHHPQYGGQSHHVGVLQEICAGVTHSTWQGMCVREGIGLRAVRVCKLCQTL